MWKFASEFGEVLCAICLAKFCVQYVYVFLYFTPRTLPWVVSWTLTPRRLSRFSESYVVFVPINTIFEFSQNRDYRCYCYTKGPICRGPFEVLLPYINKTYPTFPFQPLDELGHLGVRSSTAVAWDRLNCLGTLVHTLISLVFWFSFFCSLINFRSGRGLLTI